MFKFKSSLNNFKYKFQNPLSKHLDSSEADYWRERIFGVKRPTWKNYREWILRAVVWFFVFNILLFIWFSKDLPTPGNIKRHQSAASIQLFDRNNNPIYTYNGDVRRVAIGFNDMPAYVKEATITAEDRNFYHHIGIDFKGMARAVYNIFVRGQGLQSGSTITQQYVKNALLDQKQTLTRKIKEIFLSLEVEAMYSKDQILAMYLNEIPYGSNAHGIEAAAQTFLNKDAKDLTLAESATLAALPQRPSYFSPYGTHPDKRLIRVNYILDSMVDLKYISKEDAAKAKEEAKNIKFAQPSEYILAPHFALYVKDKLVEKYGERVIEEGGLKVTTTLDLEKQKMAEEAVKTGAAGRQAIKASNAALVAIDPKTGQVLSMVGSADYFNNEIDGQVNVADALRQPGSSFKPIVYATAFKDKYNPAYTLWDVNTDFNGYQPKNYDLSTHGPVSMRQALAGSLNIPAVKTLFLAGVDKSLDTAHSMGITSLNDRDRYGLSLVLGGGEVKLIDMATAYGVFANAGKLAPTITVLKVEDSRGKVLEEYKENKDKFKEALDPQIAYQISSILSDNGARAYVFGANSSLNFYDRQVAVKTGTTSEYRDAWTIGYTPQLVAGVWVGNNDNSPMAAGAAGAMAAAPIWHRFMASALGGAPVENFQRPKGISDVTVDKLSNKLPTENSPETITDVFASWQVPTAKDNIHIKAILDKATGFLATAGCPSAYTETKVYTAVHSEQPNNPSWENPVVAAAPEFGINVGYPPTQTACTVGANDLSVKFATPTNGATTDSSFTAKVAANSKAKKMELSVDGKTVGTDVKSPFQFAVKGLSDGKHNLTAIAYDSAGKPSSASIDITVVAKNADTNAPGNVSGVSVSANVASATIKWTNPSDSDLKKVNIYQSSTSGDLGSQISSLGQTPSSAGTTEITGLTSSQQYWFTLRTVDANGNENTDSTQYQVTIL